MATLPRLLSTAEFDPDSEVLAIITGVVDDLLTEKVDQQHELTISVYPDADWLEYVEANQHVVFPVNGVDQEWRIGARSRGFVGREQVVSLQLDPLHSYLADLGPVHRKISGGVEQVNNGGKNLPIRKHWFTFIQPHHEDRDVDGFWELGTVASTFQFDLALEGQNTVAWIRAMAAAAGLEWYIERDTVGSVYKVHFPEEVGSTAGMLWLSEGHNLRRFFMRNTREGHATIVRPYGLQPDGGVQSADMGQHRYRVTAISAGELTVEARGDSRAPVLEDDQYVANAGLGLPTRYVRRPDTGALHAITSTTAPNKITPAATTGIAVGDDIQICADSSGTPLTEVESPSAVAINGLVWGKLQTNHRGEGNHVRNPGFGEWPATAPSAVNFLVNGGHVATTTIVLKSGPADQVLKANDGFQVATAFTNKELRKITADATADGSGNVTVTVSEACSFAGDESVLLFLQDSKEPTYFARPTTGNGGSVWMKTPRRPATTITGGQLNGAQTVGSLSGGTHDNKLLVDGLPANQAIEAGWLLVASGYVSFIMTATTADGSGNATLTLLTSSGGLADNLAFTLYVPDLADVAAGYAVGHYQVNRSGTAVSRLATTTYNIPLIKGLVVPTDDTSTPSKMTLHAFITFRAMAAVTGAGGGWDASTRIAPAVLLTDETGATISPGTGDVTSVSDDNWSPTAVGEMRKKTLRLVRTMTAADDVQIHFRVPHDTSGGWNGTGAFAWITGVQIHLGPQADVPLVEGAYANNMHLDANDYLSQARYWTTRYEADALEFAKELADYPEHPAIEIGQTVRPKVPTISVDENARIMEKRTRHVLAEVDGAPGRVTEHSLQLRGVPKALTGSVISARQKKLFVLSGDTQLIASDTPPLLTPGAPRASVPVGVTAPADDDPVPVYITPIPDP